MTRRLSWIQSNTFARLSTSTKKRSKAEWLEQTHGELRCSLKDYYRAAYAKSKQRKWVFGSHYMRKLYAVASYNIYQTQITQITSKFVDQSYWISTVLAHAGSIATSLSYSNVVVSFGFKVELFKTPP